MLQIMNDEFDVNVDDGSAEEVAAKILELKKATRQGDFKAVDEMMAEWEEKQRKGGHAVKMKFVEGGSDGDNSDWDSDGRSEDANGDMEMDDAPDLVEAPKGKSLPEVDDEGFTRVVGRRKR